MLDGCFVAVGTAAKTRSAQTFRFGYFARVSVFLWNTHLTQQIFEQLEEKIDFFEIPKSRNFQLFFFFQSFFT